ncbi:M23 family metallopeptidase [Maribacter hydrothermalis]|uniref:Peptidase M23 n=1 Tax=Maribacter hydrothermalis TaxID=1836467 RepID=A0A1B7ZDF8_9FLAO|nr:M23 family metallopeptidase [Maribacter hydrothermalis]APQ18405.1 peptidase M23 [Maribacter hydrothermalis]OBR41388.1 peptidase M23 [Maribacter hydrothermalis]
MKKIPLILLLLFCFPLFSQEEYPKDAFRPPMDIPIILAGTFGELRSNHFHSGVDIKTQQREGIPIMAIGEGTITRIKVSLWGYGKVLYIAHPNGYNSVYGHLQKFSPAIEAYIKKLQYDKKSFEVEVFPDYGELKVEKGELIAYSGNTGGSAGPHLHFEIRSSISEKPTNPLLYGLDVADATNPIVEKIFAYPLKDQSHINGNYERTQINFSRQSDGTYLADKVNALGDIGIGFIGFDRLDMAANKNGVYAVEFSVNGKIYSLYDFESFSFGETRYINTLVDYDYYGRNNQRIQKSFKSPGNNLNIYKELFNDGKLQVNEGLSYMCKLLISDYAGNKIELNIPIEGVKNELGNKKKIEKTDNYVIANKPNNFDLDGAKVYFPTNTFYEDFYIDLKKGSDTVTIHNNTVPAHRNFTITFDVSKYPTEIQKQLFIARLDAKLRPTHANTYKRGNEFTTRTRYLGTYTLARDTVAPTIRTKNFKEKQWLNNYKYLSLQIADDLSGVDSYSATLNGEWILMEYEPKTNTLTYNFDDRITSQTQCELIVTVIDNVGNENTLTTSFYRK